MFNLCVVQQITLLVRSFLQTWPKKKWQSSSLVTTVACATQVLPATLLLEMCALRLDRSKMPDISADTDHKDSYVGDEAQSKRRKCSLLDDLDIIPELKEWLEGLNRRPC